MQLLGRMHTVLSNSAFSSWASCFLMKVRTEWTASGSATPIMSIISPSPGRVIVFTTNSWKSRGHWIEVTLVHSPFPQYFFFFFFFPKWKKSYFIQAWVTEYASEPMHKIWIQNQWLVLLEISHQAEHQLACQQLSSLPTEQKNNQVNFCPSVAQLQKRKRKRKKRVLQHLERQTDWTHQNHEQEGKTDRCQSDQIQDE